MDDDAAIRSIIRHIIDGAPGLTVVAEAGDGAAGFRAAVDHVADAVVTDLQMPGCDGLELTRRLRAEGRQLPIVMLTGSPLPRLEELAAEAGVTTVLHKAEDLMSVVPALKEGLLALDASASMQ